MSLLLLQRPLLAGASVAAYGAGYVFTNAEAATLVAAMTVPPSDARKALIDDLVGGLKSDSIWSDLDLLYVPAAHDAQAGLLNWVAPASFLGVAVNSPTFTTDRGHAGDGATSRVRTQFTPSTHATKMTQDNASLWLWSGTSNANINESEAGNSSGNQLRFKIRTGASNDQTNGIVNDATNDTLVLSGVTDSIGLFGIQRTTATHKRTFKNGVQVGSDVARASIGLAAAEQWFCAANTGQWSTKRIQAAIWGRSLTGKESALYTRLATYMTAIGA